MRMKSQRLYEHLRKERIMLLPGRTCLQRYLRSFRSGFGFNRRVFSALKENWCGMSGHQRHGGILLDEMKLSENLPVDQYGQVKGLVDLGQFSTGSASSVMADHALVVIFQPFTGKWHEVLGVFASKGNVKATLLAKIILECIILAEKSGLFVDFVTTDAASWNRSMWRIFGITGKLERVVCKTSHPVDSKRQLHFVSDFPHLVKNVRNSFLHHPFATPEGTATVKHIEVAWECDQQGSISLKAMPKIHRSVVKPDGFEKMRVSYAFRIFSDEVRRGLFMYKEQIEWRHGSINATESCQTDERRD
ncbi:hypothetical protein HPB49_002143 [Dermacentor silvarum]|uniref:Uncharacterized protein n=1 Tax=Dermacentor silvarum TaxID=543639 RepID=A0ACB8CP83_DERSI|nr:hypothetical protein HPB49_002143 [Dermacentor silvarum]